MERIVTRAAPYLYALLRIIGALLYACHGAQKVLGLFGGVQGGTVPLMSLMGLAGLIELGAGLLIAGGILTRPAAFLAGGGQWPIRSNASRPPGEIQTRPPHSIAPSQPSLTA